MYRGRQQVLMEAGVLARVLDALRRKSIKSPASPSQTQPSGQEKPGGVAAAEQPQTPVSRRPSTTPATPVLAARPGLAKRNPGVNHIDVQVPGEPVARDLFHPHPLAAQNALVHRTRQDMSAAHDRYQTHKDKYNDQKARILDIRHLGSGGLDSSNNVFKAEQDNDHEKAIKPLGEKGMHETHEPQYVEARHNAVYDWLSSIGAHHMTMPAFAGTFPENEKIPANHGDPDENHGQFPRAESEKRQMPRYHAGTKAHIVEWAKGSTRACRASDDMLNKVDDHHRLIGMLTHVLFSNSDGHGGNVLIDKTGHPVLIDHDLVLNSLHNQVLRRSSGGKKEVVSVFAPGGSLAYDKNGKQWGTNYPPETAAVLSEIAQGGWSKRHGLPVEDELELQQNAYGLLTHGLEEMLLMRDVSSA